MQDGVLPETTTASVFVADIRKDGIDISGRAWTALVLLPVVCGGTFFSAASALREMAPVLAVLHRPGIGDDSSGSGAGGGCGAGAGGADLGGHLLLHGGADGGGVSAALPRSCEDRGWKSAAVHIDHSTGCDPSG
jgi:hypothetical protein